MRAPNRLKFWKHYSLGGHFGSFSALRFYATLPSHLGREGLWFLGVLSVELTRAKSASAGRRALAWRTGRWPLRALGGHRIVIFPRANYPKR